MWQQYALSLVAAGRPERALLVLEEAVRLNPGQTVLLLMAAKTCYQNLHQVSQHTSVSQQYALLPGEVSCCHTLPDRAPSEPTYSQLEDGLMYLLKVVCHLQTEFPLYFS